MDDTIIKFLLVIVFVAIVIIILFYGITDKILSHGTTSATSTTTATQIILNENIDKTARTNRLYTYIFSIIIPLVGIMFYLKEELL